MKTILFDLENVLIHSVGRPRLHPEAKQVLRESQRDFDKVCLWTLADILDIKEPLERLGLLPYFNRVIGQDMDNKRRVFFTAVELENGKEVKRWQICEPTYGNLVKNLSFLGNPKDYVLIDDQKFRAVGIPMDRVIGIRPYSGQKEHSLWPAYREALRLSKQR